eukprot:7520094-Lingulodinium_polyedra.AAC.1
MLDILSAKTSSFSDRSIKRCRNLRRRLRNDSSSKDNSNTAKSKAFVAPPPSDTNAFEKNCLKLATLPGFP